MFFKPSQKLLRKKQKSKWKLQLADWGKCVENSHVEAPLTTHLPLWPPFPLGAGLGTLKLCLNEATCKHGLGHKSRTGRDWLLIAHFSTILLLYLPLWFTSKSVSDLLFHASQKFWEGGLEYPWEVWSSQALLWLHLWFRLLFANRKMAALKQAKFNGLFNFLLLPKDLLGYMAGSPEVVDSKYILLMKLSGLE